MEIPVYLFTGFLEAGKTMFIQETLEDKRFNGRNEKTLLLLCEEGVEEYEPEKFASPSVFIEVLENESDLNRENLQNLLKKHKARRVVVEYNGMWMLDSLYQNMPDNWSVYQEFMFADAATFLNYNANMRGLMVDKLQSCEIVILNRFKREYDENKLMIHKIVRTSNRRCDIAFDYGNDHVEYDDIEDPLPFDVEAPIIQIKDEDYAVWYRDLSENPARYENKKVCFKGLVALNSRLPKNCFAAGRHVMTCCADDIAYAGILCLWDSASTLKSRQWVKVTATINTKAHKGYGGKTGPVLTVTDVALTSAPEQEVATFY